MGKLWHDRVDLRQGDGLMGFYREASQHDGIYLASTIGLAEQLCLTGPAELVQLWLLNYKANLFIYLEHFYVAFPSNQSPQSSKSKNIYKAILKYS